MNQWHHISEFPSRENIRDNYFLLLCTTNSNRVPFCLIAHFDFDSNQFIPSLQLPTVQFLAWCNIDMEAAYRKIDEHNQFVYEYEYRKQTDNL